MTSGKLKGNSWERVVCRDLSLWWTLGKRDDVFWRSAMSGGRATVHAKRGSTKAHISGDICAVHSLGNAFVDKYYCECKSYRDLNLPSAVTRGSGKMLKFWRETKHEAKRYGKFPVLIWKQNQLPPMVGLSTFAADALGIDTDTAGRVIFHDEDLHLLPYSEVFTKSRKRPRL